MTAELLIPPEPHSKLPDWLELARTTVQREQAAVMVSVLQVTGSTPREAGAVMLVTASGSCATIGGGNLEFQAIQQARQLLGTRHCLLREVTLGPALGQCCGGVVVLHFEALLGSSAWLESLATAWQQGKHCTVRSTPLWWPPEYLEVAKLPTHPLLGSGRVSVEAVADAALGLLAHPTQTASLAVYERFGPPEFRLAVFGAGHVGSALVRTLAHLPCGIDWFDSRPAVFPPLPSGAASIRVRHLSDPLSGVSALPAGCYALVMTHDHALDLELCAALLTRADLAFYGLIGSRTKKALFRQRLLARGLAPERLAQLCCPIGIEGIRDKHPAALALAVAAQLLQLREAHVRTARGDR